MTLPASIQLPQESLSSVMGAGVNTGLQQALQQFQATQQQKKSAKGLAQFFGEPALEEAFSNIPLEMHGHLAKQKLENQAKEQAVQVQKEKAEAAKQKILTPYKTAMDLVNRQKELLRTGHLGGKFQVLGTGRDWGSTRSKEGIKTRAEYERIGKQLIGLATTFGIIRNLKEFETIKKGLTDPTLSKEEIEGNIEGMALLFKSKLGELLPEENFSNELISGMQEPTSSMQQSTEKQHFEINGKKYDIPNHLVPAFKKSKGIK